MFRLTRKLKAPAPERIKPQGFATRALMCAAKYALEVLCVALAVLAMLQISVIIAVEKELEIPVPPHFLRHFSAGISRLGLKAGCSRAYFDFTGGIRIKDLRITDMQGNELLAAAQVYAHVSPERLQSGGIDIDTLLVDDASVILPAFMSESGTDTPLAHDLSAVATIRGSQIRVEALQTIVSSLPISVECAFDIRAAKSGAKEVSSNDLPRTIIPYMKRLEGACHALDNVEAPILSIAPGANLSDFHIACFAKSVKYDDCEIGGVFADFSVGVDKVLRNVFVSADTFEGKGVSATLIQTRPGGPIVLPSDYNGIKNFSADASFLVSRASFRGETASGVYVDVNVLPSFVSAHSAFMFDGNLQKLDISKIEGGNAEIDYELVAGLETCIRLAKLPKEAVTSRVSAPNPFRAEGHASIPAGIKGWKTNFEFRTREVAERGFLFDKLYICGSARQGFVKFGKVVACSGLSRAEGSFSQDLNTLDWRMDVKGEVIPPELTPILGHWWDEIWTDFVFDGPRVNADLTIKGNWNERHYALVRGSVGMKHILYSGARIESGSLGLSVGEGFIDIYDMWALTPKGGINGNLAWLLRPDDTMTVVVDIVSDVPAETLDKAFGSALTDQLPDWRFAKPPTISIKGNFEKLAPGVWKNDMYVLGESGPGSWRGLPFDKLGAKIWSKENRTVVKIDNCSLMNGRLAGNIDFVRDGQSRNVKIDFAMSDTDFTPTLKALQSLGGKKPDPEAQEKAGKVDLAFSGGASADDFLKTLDGSGRFLIHDAELGKIKVFGALSSLFESIGLNAGTFSLNTVKSNVSIYHGLVRFRHAELSGPAVRIEAKGSMALEGGAMDFDAKVFLLSGNESTLVNAIGAIITPVGYISELTLGGTIDDPTWRFKLDPRNLFNAKEAQKPSAANPTSENPAK